MLTMFDPIASVTDSPGKTMVKWTPLVLTLVVRPQNEVYIEWPHHEPLGNVIAMMHNAERGSQGPWAVCFDPDDPDMLEATVGGYRLYGMFVNDLI